MATICRECGSRLHPDQTICPLCGTVQLQAMIDAQNKKIMQEKKNPTVRSKQKPFSLKDFLILSTTILITLISLIFLICIFAQVEFA